MTLTMLDIKMQNGRKKKKMLSWGGGGGWGDRSNALLL